MATPISQQLQDLAATQADQEAQHNQLKHDYQRILTFHAIIQDRLQRAQRATQNLPPGQHSSPSDAMVAILVRTLAGTSPEPGLLRNVLVAAIALPGATDPTAALKALHDAVAALPPWLTT